MMGRILSVIVLITTLGLLSPNAFTTTRIKDSYYKRIPIATTPDGHGLLGIQGDAPFSGAMTGVIIRENTFYKYLYGIEFRGILNSTITQNRITHAVNWGVMVRRSQGCLPVHDQDWLCFYSTANTITDNFVIGNGADRVKVGSEIPDCITPSAMFLPFILRFSSP
jgi:hypothetical protein